MAPPLGELARPQAVTERALSASLCSAPPPKGEALLRCRTTCPVEWCGAPGGFGTRPYEVRIGAAVSGKGRGTRPLPGGTGLSVTGKCLIPHFQFLNFSRRA